MHALIILLGEGDDVPAVRRRERLDVAQRVG